MFEYKLLSARDFDIVACQSRGLGLGVRKYDVNRVWAALMFEILVLISKSATI